MRQDGVRQASDVCQGSGVGSTSGAGCVRMRQEGVWVASGRHQDNSASRWRQDEVEQRGARINWQRLQLPRLLSWFCVEFGCSASFSVGIGMLPHGTSPFK